MEHRHRFMKKPVSSVKISDAIRLDDGQVFLVESASEMPNGSVFLALAVVRDGHAGFTSRIYDGSTQMRVCRSAA